MKVKIIWEMIQDGESDITEYDGYYGIINDTENISFSEKNNKTKHLLKVTEDALKWIRTIDGDSNAGFVTDFMAGDSTCLDYETPYGNIKLEIETQGFRVLRDDKAGLPEIHLAYCLRQDGMKVSEYRVRICVNETGD